MEIGNVMIQAHYVNVLDCQNLETIPFKLEDVSGMTDLAKSNPIFPFFDFDQSDIIQQNFIYLGAIPRFRDSKC